MAHVCTYVHTIINIPQREREFTFVMSSFAAEPRVVGLAPPKTDQTTAVSGQGGVGGWSRSVEGTWNWEVEW